MTIEENVPLAPLTTFGIGGPARFFARAASVEDVRAAIAFAEEKNLPLLPLGGGSNMLVDDAGFPGLVLKIELRGIEECADGDSVELLVGAGESWDGVVAHAVARGLRGIENLSGIPGTAGAAPMQNIGAYGAELAESISFVETYNRETKILRRFTPDLCGFGYRTSIFKLHPGTFVVLRIGLRLSKQPAPKLSYRDLAEHFKDNAEPSLADIRAAVLAIRARKFPDLAEEGTAGSFFLNPTVSPSEAAWLTQLFPGLPAFPAHGGVKISLAYILDKGLGLRGFAHGGARLFERQPLVVVAARNASADDVHALAREVRERVHDACGIAISPEVQIIGAAW